MAIKVTLDTNCFFEYFERDPTYIQDLLNLQAQGHIEIAMTTRVMADTLNKWKGPGTSPIWTKIRSFPIVETIGSAFEVGLTYLDSGDYLIDDSDEKIINRLQDIMLGAQAEDVGHLFAHMRAERDIFVTSDFNHFLSHKEQLKKEFRVEILNLKDAIQRLQEMFMVRTDIDESTA